MLENIQVDQLGTYICVAENVLGKTQTNAELRVISKFIICFLKIYNKYNKKKFFFFGLRFRSF